MNIPVSILNKMSPDLKLMIFGMGEAGVQKLRDVVEYAYRDFEGRQDFTSDDLDKDLKRQITTLTGMGFSTSAALTGRRLEEGFRYQTQPAFAVSSKLMGEYGSKVMSAFGRAQEISHDWGMLAGKTALTLAGMGTTISVGRAVNAARNAARGIQVAQAAQNINRARRIIMGIRGAATFAGSAGGIIGSGVGFVVGTIVQEAVYRIFVRLTKQRAENLAFSEMAAELFDRQRIVGDFNIYRGALQGFSGYDGSNAYSIFDGILQQERLGVTLDRYGADYTKMSSLSKKLITKGMMTDENFEGYMGRSVQLEALYGADFSDIMTGISVLTFGDKDVDEASQLFEEFFVSVAGGGTPHVSQLALVQELMGFSQSYVQGQKFNLEGYSNLARISNFLTPIYDMHTTQPIQTLVTGVDTALGRGVQGQQGFSRVMSEFTTNYGISQEQALKGLTSHPDVFENFLKGIVVELGIGHDSFDITGNLSEEKMIHLFRYAQQGLGMDNSTVQSIIPAIRAYTGGSRVEDVSREFFEQEEITRAGILDRFAYTDLLTEFGKGSRALSSMILENVDLMKEIDTLTVRMYQEKIPGIVGSLGEMVLTIGSWLSGTPIIREGLATGAASVAGGLTSITLPDEMNALYFNKLFDSLVYQESRGIHTLEDGSLKTNKLSGARGITQVMPDTGVDPGFWTDPLGDDDSIENYLRFGRQYLSGLLRYYGGDVRKALAAYNWGPGKVDRAVENHGGNWESILPLETSTYIYEVLGRMDGHTYRNTGQYTFNDFANEGEEGYNDNSPDSPNDDENSLEIDLDAGVYYNDDFVEYITSRVMA